MLRTYNDWTISAGGLEGGGGWGGGGGGGGGVGGGGRPTRSAVSPSSWCITMSDGHHSAGGLGLHTRLLGTPYMVSTNLTHHSAVGGTPCHPASTFTINPIMYVVGKD